VKLLCYPESDKMKVLNPRLRSCALIHDMVLRGIILRAKALAYIVNTLIEHILFIATCSPGHVAQGFNPAKADCDTVACAVMT
jgi:hypothetical protein